MESLVVSEGMVVRRTAESLKAPRIVMSLSRQ